MSVMVACRGEDGLTLLGVGGDTCASYVVASHWRDWTNACDQEVPQKLRCCTRVTPMHLPLSVVREEDGEAVATVRGSSK